jgi:hypothetical protein
MPTYSETLEFSSSMRNDYFSNDGKYFVWYGNDLRKSDVLGGNYNKLKVIVNKPGYLKPRFDNGNYNTSANNYWVEVNNETEANNIISFFDSNVGQCLFNKYFKYSGFNSLGILKKIPKLVKEHIWNDDKFINIFGITQEELNFLYNIQDNVERV